MATNGMKRSFISNTSCFSNLYLIECFIKCKPKSYLKAILMIVEKGLSVTKKKLDCLKMKMCKGVRLRRVKIKGFVQKWQMREKTIPTNLSSKHEVCSMMKFAFMVMDTCLWYLDSGCSRHMTGNHYLFKVFEFKKGGNVTFMVYGVQSMFCFWFRSVVQSGLFWTILTLPSRQTPCKSHLSFLLCFWLISTNKRKIHFAGHGKRVSRL